MRQRYVDLLREWCDGLLRYQIHGTGNPRLDGGILCPACMVIHGRCQELAYPLLCLADVTGEARYAEAAKELFRWGENLQCDDGSMYNDAQSSWNGITVFSAISLYEALTRHGDLLGAERPLWEERMHAQGRWIYENLTTDFQTNVNYYAACAYAMEALGIYEKNLAYRKRADEMAEVCFRHVTPEGLFFGEGKPMDYVTHRGCRPVDIGYNVEESLPSLVHYALLAENENALEKTKKMLSAHLDFMLPDGGWDNSFGTRNFKWTYWGSRTSDGCQAGYGIWGDDEPVFAEAAWRNFCLYAACTHDGLLAGGPDYAAAGEPACVHHSFSHCKTLAAVLDAGIQRRQKTQLPAECAEGIRYYPTLDTYKVFKGNFIATVTAYDFEYCTGGHACGGVMSMLWHRHFGVLAASGMTEYSLYEAHNMQQSQKKSSHRSLTPGIFTRQEGRVFAQWFDEGCVMEAFEEEQETVIRASGILRDRLHAPLEDKGGWHAQYLFGAHSVTVRLETEGDCEFVFPLTAGTLRQNGEEKNRILIEKEGRGLLVQCSRPISSAERIFNLVPGLQAWELTTEIPAGRLIEFSISEVSISDEEAQKLAGES